MFFGWRTGILPAVRPTSTRCMGPDFSTTKVGLLPLTQTCCSEGDYPLHHDASFHPSKFHRFQIERQIIEIPWTHVCQWSVDKLLRFVITSYKTLICIHDKWCFCVQFITLWTRKHVWLWPETDGFQTWFATTQLLCHVNASAL